MGRCLLLAGLMLLPALGCGSSKGTVKGTVTFQGQPLEKGLVTFNPLTQGGTAGGDIVKGNFVVKDLTPGKYQVHVEAVRADIKFTSPDGPESKRRMSEAEQDAQANPLPPDTKGFDQEFEVKHGEQTMPEFKLTSASQQ